MSSPSPPSHDADRTEPDGTQVPATAAPSGQASRHDSWGRRHATLAAWKAGRTLDRALGEIRSALDDDSALEPEVRALLSRAAGSTAEAAAALEELRSYLAVHD